ncbi:MAG: hypothetical protein GC168_14515 [Candidatus Hydrogenedens sp.]|nr:hypothetical protein [Candidatus Hydrogenedens sp.]
MRQLAGIVAACAMAAAVWGEASPAPGFPVFFVSTQGDDASTGLAPEPGGPDGPFRTPARALEALRSAGGDDGHAAGATVYFREGDYYLDAPLEFGPQDSGREHAPVLWRNYRNEAVRLVGGFAVEGLAADQGDILKADLTGQLPEGVDAEAVFFDGNRQPLARWPNEGEGDLPGGGWTFVAASVPDAPETKYICDVDRSKGWASIEGAQVSIWPNYNWWQTIAPISAIDPETRTITLGEKMPYTIEPGRRFFYQNVREELDAPGEWYFDKGTRALYFWPPSPVADSPVLVPVLDHIVRIQGAHHINLLGFTFEAARDAAVIMEDSTACMLAKSVVRHTNGFGVVVQGGDHCRVLGNDIYHTGRGGIVLEGGDRKTLTPGGHEAVNNHIHHFAQLYRTYQTGVNVSGVANRVANNDIHDAPHIAILLGGNEHTIEFNDIHHVCLEGSDNGGFYMGRDWTQRGNRILHNKFHDIYGFGLADLKADKDGVYQYESPHWAWGVYLDDCSSGVEITGNLFYRVPLCGVMIGGGRDNRVTNNIFVECVPALHIDDRWDSYPWDTMQERLEAMNVTQPPYSDFYPELQNMGDDPRKPENNRFERNIISFRSDSFRGITTTARKDEGAIVYNFDQFDPETTRIDNNLIYHYDQPLRVHWSVYGDDPQTEIIDWETWLERAFDANSLIQDPRFVNPAKDDYRLNEQSPAYTLGFKPIPEHNMGLIEDEFRASPVPPRDERREGWEHRRFPVTLEHTP